ncbi:hypothetical protein predicted by Glimmer/Critica [Acetobacter senegalensis]|uniref:Uncharacterized protein n=1 Tax=Acetobacter senegalensis TaxID=446692 RepID=A0A0U5EZQ2_9PROT|nr:hypothetical protein predicted by Glimmer/Critica [Acetobacter senegalensis]
MDKFCRNAKFGLSLTALGREVWMIYDNTIFGAGTQNALELAEALERSKN